jgi:hypothetical protein
LVAPLFGGFATAFGAGDDPLVEPQAELAFDGRPVLPQISVPVLLVARDRDVTSRGTGRGERTADPRLHADLVRALGHIGHASAAVLPRGRCRTLGGVEVTVLGGPDAAGQHQPSRRPY